MTKTELLSILYAERERVEKQYARPGWTIWAIVAAVASLGWMAWGYAEECKDWGYVAMVFGTIYYFMPIAEAYIPMLKPKGTMVLWVQGEQKNKIHAITHLVLYVGVLLVQLLCILRTFYPILYWFAVAGSGLIILSGMYLCYIAFTGSPRTNSDAIWDKGLVFPFVPTIALFILYLHQLGYNPTAFRLGVLFFAIWYLLMLLPIGERMRFVRIDKLISTVLYDTAEVDEVSVLRELERCVLGLRYGHYLSETKLKQLESMDADLIKCTFQLISYLEKGDDESVNRILTEGQKLHDEILRQYKQMCMDIIAYTGDKGPLDNSYLSMYLHGLMADRILKFWEKVIALKDDKSPTLLVKIKAAYQEILGTTDMHELFKREYEKYVAEIRNRKK